MTRTLGAWTCLAACTLLITACSDSSGPDTVAPLPYEGPWPVLPEEGDAIDPGPLAPCHNSAAASIACGAREAFDLSSCDSATLASAPAEGVYILKLRYETSTSPTGGVVGASALHLKSDGSPSIAGGGQATTYERDGQSFYIARDVTLRDGTTTRTAYAGCQVSGTQQLTGCFMSCRNGSVRSRGTFEALPATRAPGEEESSGLPLVSESFVSLGLPVDVYVAKGHAYVVSVNAHGRTGGLTVFDVADKAHPVLARTVTLPGDSYWNGVWARGDALYVASGGRGVLVFDITNPAEPVFLTSLPSEPIDVHTVLVDGERLYAMSPSPNSEVLVFDITQPLVPVLLNRYTPPGGQGQGYPHDAFAYEGRLYINFWELGYLITDVSHPSSLRELGRYVYSRQTSHANAVGTIAGRTIAFEGGEGYDAHLRVLDVTEPERVGKIGEWRLRAQSSIHNMVLVGTRLYIAHYHEGVRVLDVADPTQPRQLAYFNTFREADFERGYGFYEGAIGMRVPGDGHVYVVESSRGLMIFREP
ncbi:MAG: hypothetical protein JXB05_27095 [Myxococcaceae bacterium]|nr:hypothetical protein [Myxococcaceae bacterium]